MELIMEQFPIVIHSLNVGFLQTLKLFFATLLVFARGALELMGTPDDVIFAGPTGTAD